MTKHTPYTIKVNNNMIHEQHSKSIIYQKTKQNRVSNEERYKIRNRIDTHIFWYKLHTIILNKYRYRNSPSLQYITSIYYLAFLLNYRVNRKTLPMQYLSRYILLLITGISVICIIGYILYYTKAEASYSCTSRFCFVSKSNI